MANFGYGGGYTTTTSYGAQGGAEGGGFTASQGGSQDSPSGARSFGKDTLRPVTVKQIIDAVFPHPSAEPKIDGTDVGTLSFVGQVLKVSTQTTNHTFTIDDGTGVIEVKKWVDSDAAPEHQSPLPTEGQYVHVYGTIKDLTGRRHVSGRNILLITDYNEITFHLLDAAAIHLELTRGPPGGATGGEDGLFVPNANGSAAAPGGRPNPLAGKRISESAKQVFNYLNSAPPGNEGSHVSVIATAIGLPSNEVFKAGDELLGEGLIYTTMDDETWTVLDY